MSDTHVVPDDLAALAARFSSGATAFDSAAKSFQCPAADSGDGACNSAIHALTDMLAVLTQSMTASIEDHSTKLGDARGEYLRTEDVNKNRFLWDNLNEDFS